MRSIKPKAIVTVLWMIPLGLAFTAHVAAGDAKPNGKELYKQNCKVCHAKDSPHGEYTPITLIQDQWRSFFKEKLVPTHKDATVPGQPVRLLDSLTPEQMKAIEKFCVDHAADSEQPQTCS